MPNTPSSTPIHPRAIATRKVAASQYGLKGRWATVQVLPASNRGRNARGTSAAKQGWGSGQVKCAKRAKGQSTHGNRPNVAATRWGWV